MARVPSQKSRVSLRDREPESPLHPLRIPVSGPEDKCFPHSNPGTHREGWPLAGPYLSCSIYFGITLSLSFVPLAQMFLCSERKSRTIARSEYILPNFQLAHTYQTSFKKRYFKHRKGAEFKTSYYIIGVGGSIC